MDFPGFSVLIGSIVDEFFRMHFPENRTDDAYRQVCDLFTEFAWDKQSYWSAVKLSLLITGQGNMRVDDKRRVIEAARTVASFAAASTEQLIRETAVHGSFQILVPVPISVDHHRFLSERDRLAFGLPDGAPSTEAK